MCGLTVRCRPVADGSARPVGETRHGWESCRHGSQIDCEVPARGVLSAAPAPRGPVRWIASLREDRRDLVRFWPVVQNMVVQELRVRYQRSFLGFVWTLLNPILMMVILSWVFGHIMHAASKLPALSVRGHGSLELSEHQLE